jgi:cyclohexanone monooxygenase
MTEETRQVDAVVVGAGFAGLYMLHRLRGDGWSAQVFERGSGVGGTWYWNRYPGARCDVESLEYSYQFDDALQQEWEWTERYAGQPEILRYLEHVADRFDLRRDIQFDTRVVAAAFDERTSRWTVRTAPASGAPAAHGAHDDVVSARFLIMATGCLSSANLPDIPGLETYGGEVLHTGRWPHEGVDFSGKRVGVIGTGSSGIQAIPIIAKEAGELVVFQRTANYSVPARNAPLDPEEQKAVKQDYAGLRARNRMMPTGFGSRLPPPGPSALEAKPEEREREFEARWERGGFGFLASYADLTLDRGANATAAEFVRSKIREIVDDPAVADLLSPSQVIGCKRLCLDSGYFETFNRPNVRLVDISGTPIEAMTPTGLRVDGEDFELDCIVFATGFDAMTGSLLAIDICGRHGTTLRDAWSAGPRTYLGLGVPEFPNLFVITGPGSPSVLTNMVVSIEQHVDWITECIGYLRDQGLDRIEASHQAADDWVAYVNSIANLTLFPYCNSWYLGANVPGKPRVFMPLPGFPPYDEQCKHVAATGYDGFALA